MTADRDFETDTIEPCFDPSRKPFDLPEIEGWPAQRHQFAELDIWAVRAALVTGRPLLVRGEPGTGKSQLARAVAVAMGRPLLYEVITSHTEVTDLLFELDAVARLGEAQVLGASRAGRDQVRSALAPERFIRPGKIWWALSWPSASAQAELSGTPPPAIEEGAWRRGCVLLVDEIDKADAELPNALLGCFANQSFQVPQRPQAVSRAAEQPPPLVVVTTNEERELPAAFLRRCMVHHLELAADDEQLAAFLVARGQVHFAPQYGDLDDYQSVLEAAAARLIEDRKLAAAGALHRPGQAEYLDLCRAVFEIARRHQQPAAEVLAAVAGFALRKNPLSP